MLSRAQTSTPDFPLPEALRRAAPEIGRWDAPASAAFLAGAAARLRRGEAGTTEPKELVDAALSVCRALFEHGRSGETLELARELLASCSARGDLVQLRRTTFLYAMLLSDTGDLVGAAEHYAQALRMAT